ncbi:MAG: erythromycin esterase family protein [Ferruginibacter sp.]
MKKISLTCIISFAVLMLHAQAKASIDWLNSNLLPVKSLRAENGMEDLKKLDSFIGDARIVGLGEFTHGSDEVFTMKHRLLEYLVKEKGFTIFSIEASMPEAYKLNDYIINGKGNAKELLGGMYFWTWYTQEVLDMIEWMKQYNYTSSKKIYFTGFDMQFYKVALTNVSEFCTKHSIPFAEKLSAFDSAASKLVYTFNRNNRKEATPVVEIAATMLKDFESYTQAKQDPDYSWIKQNISILWQYAARNTKAQGRDESMAQNIQWIADQNPGSKIVLWAHNGHINKKKYWMGKFLEEKFGNNYLAIGFAGESGTYTAFNRINNRNKLDSANTLSASNKKNYEYYLKAANNENYILVLNQMKQNEQNEFLFDKKNLRHIGARVEEEKRQFVPTDLLQEYDALIFIRNSSSSKCFSVAK